MDKQQSDHIEHRIRQAAENFDPPFNEEAWKKMESLLDQGNNDRRRGFIWWWYGLFFCLIIGGGILFYHYKGSGTDKMGDEKKGSETHIGSGKDKNEVEISGKDESKLPIQEPSPEINQEPTTRINIAQGDSRTNEHQVKKAISMIPVQNLVSKRRNQARKPGEDEKPGNEKLVSNKNNNSKIEHKRSAYTATGGVSKHEIVVDNSGVGEGDNKASQTTKPTALDPHTDSVTGTGKREVPLKDTGRVATIPPQANIASDSSVSKKEMPKNKKSKTADVIDQPGLYILGSIAADASAVKKFVLNKRKPVYGIGIGYRFNKRINVQTGFYAGRKIYKAGSEDYKADPASYLGRLKILSVDADCIIYEVPVSLRYDFVSGKKLKVYAIAGLSSFIMKREKYKYHVTGSMGYFQKDSTYTGNKNFFSSAGFSIGVEQKLFNAFYFQAEPYIRVPISGVGEGKVKLYSAGLQVGLKYQPIRKKKK